MKKAIIKGIVTIAVCAVLISVTQASISVENSISVSGTGIVDHYIEAQTHFGLFGQKYTEELRTPALGLFGVSQIDNRAEFSMLTGNDTDIFTEGAMLSNYTSTMYCMRNYDLGAVQEFLYRGDTTISYEFMADNFSSLMVVEGTTDGKTEYNIVLKDRDTHETLYNEHFEFLGLLGYNEESYIENVTYPSAGDRDWLGCP